MDEVVLAMKGEAVGRLGQDLDHALHDRYMGKDRRGQRACEVVRIGVVDRLREVSEPVGAGAKLLRVPARADQPCFKALSLGSGGGHVGNPSTKSPRPGSLGSRGLSSLSRSSM